MFEAELSCVIDNSCAIQIRGYLFLLPSYTSVKKEKRNKKKRRRKSYQSYSHTIYLKTNAVRLSFLLLLFFSVFTTHNWLYLDTKFVH